MGDSDNDSGGHPNVGGGMASPREQDRFLPIANVSRIMKRALPANAKISKDAKETVQECVSEFISFITGEASDKCQRERRKTINGDDLLWAMTTLGFEDYVEPLKGYLQRFRELEGEKTAVVTRDTPGGGEYGGTAAAAAPGEGNFGLGGFQGYGPGGSGGGFYNNNNNNNNSGGGGTIMGHSGGSVFSGPGVGLGRPR